MKKVFCAYCGKLVSKPEREHVFPRCLYPPSKGNSKIQRLTIPACGECKRGWSEDEAHFRNMLVLAGEHPNNVRKELWKSTVLRSFTELDGFRRRQDLITRLKTIKLADKENLMIFPGEDERVMRVIRKVIRGLCYYHKLMSPVSDDQVWADILKYKIPPELLNQLDCHHREQDIVEYRYQIMNEDGFNSAWYITFFERVTFIGLVSTEHFVS